VAEPIDAGIVVGGPMAAQHLEAARAMDEVRLLGLCGGEPEAAAKLARQHKTTAFPSLEMLLECDALDLVIVASPRRVRGRQALAAIEAARHVWLVPPVASAAEMRRLEAAAKRANVRLGVALSARRHPAARALRETVAGGRIGTVAMVRYALRLHAADAEDALATELANAIDLVTFVAGGAPQQVFAAARQEPGRYLIAHLALAGGTIATVEVHVAPPDEKAFPPREQLTVVGTKGTRRAGTSLKSKLIHSGAHPLAGHVEALRAMVRHVRGGPPPLAPAEARAAVEACLAAERSAKRGQPVTLGAGRAG